MRSERRAPFGNPLGQGGAAGGEINQESRGFRRAECSLWPQMGHFNIFWVANHGADNLCPLSDRQWRFRPLRAGRQQRLRPRSRARMDDERVTRCHEMLCHGDPHDARSDPADGCLCHGTSLAARRFVGADKHE